MASTFGINTWYQVSQDTPSSPFLGSSNTFTEKHHGNTFGSAWLGTAADPNISPGYWQFFPAPTNPSQFLIRPQQVKIDGTSMWLGAFENSYFQPETTCTYYCNNTGVAVSDFVSDSSYWTITPSGDNDGSVYFSNKANGSDLLLNVAVGGPAPGAYLNMAQAGADVQQKFHIDAAQKINNSSFSTLPPDVFAAPSSTATFFTTSSTALPSPTPPPVAPPPPPPHHIHIGAIVGVIVAGVAAIIFGVVALLWLRLRRKRSKQRREGLDQKKATGPHPSTAYELATDVHVPEAPTVEGISMPPVSELSGPPGHGGHVPRAGRRHVHGWVS